MIYAKTNKATDWPEKNWKDSLIRVILFFVPRANPDTEKHYPDIHSWLLELDESYNAIREIAIDKSGTILFCTPNKNNFGFWTDTDYQFKKEELVFVEKEYFEQRWSEIVV